MVESITSSLKLTEDAISDKQGFFRYMTSLNEKDRNTIMNMLQYMVLAIIPVILVLKIMKHFVPLDEPDKSSLELVGEVLFQISIIFVSFFFIHRMILYIPTYSQMNYPDVSFICVILPTLLILFTMQTKLGTKINTLNSRLFQKLGLEEQEQVEETPKSNTKVAQPPANQQQMQQQMPNQGPSGPMNHPYSGPNFDNMYVDTTTPLVNAQSPGAMSTNINNYNNQMMSEPMAANDFGGMGGALF